MEIIDLAGYLRDYVLSIIFHAWNVLDSGRCFLDNFSKSVLPSSCTPMLDQKITGRMSLGLIIGITGVLVVVGWSPNSDIPFNHRLIGDLMILMVSFIMGHYYEFNQDSAITEK